MTLRDIKQFDGQGYWFIVHGAVDLILAVPLLAAPQAFLEWLGWHTVDPFTARVVAAALIGIGGESLIGFRADLTSVKTMLNLKILWAVAAIVGTLWSAVTANSVPWGALPIAGLFAVFLVAWIVWRMRISGFAGK